MFFGSGLFINDRLVLPYGHNFDPIHWSGDIVCHRKIFLCHSGSAYASFFSLLTPSNSLIEWRIIRLGLEAENLTDYDEISCSSTTDLALLRLDKVVSNLSKTEHFDPKINSSSCTSSYDLPTKRKLFLIGYNGELSNDEDLNPYKY